MDNRQLYVPCLVSTFRNESLDLVFFACHHWRLEKYRGHRDCSVCASKEGFITECIIWEGFLSEGQTDCEYELVFDTLEGHTSWGKKHMTVFPFEMKKLWWMEGKTTQRGWRMCHLFSQLTFSLMVTLVVRLCYQTQVLRGRRRRKGLKILNQDGFKWMLFNMNKSFWISQKTPMFGPSPWLFSLYSYRKLQNFT